MTGPEQYPGEPAVEAFIEDDTHLVILDLTALAFPLDGIVPALLRAIADEGLMSAANALAHNRSATTVARDAMLALQSRRIIAQVLQIPLTPEQAAVLRDQLDEAQVAPDPCLFGACTSLAVEFGYCAAHAVDELGRAG